MRSEDEVKEIVAAILGRRKGTAWAIKNSFGWKDVRPSAKSAKMKNVVEEKWVGKFIVFFSFQTYIHLEIVNNHIL